MNIDFEELDLVIQGIAVSNLSGSFDVEDDGTISSITIMEWFAHGREPKRILLTEQTRDGLSRVFWHTLRPALRQRFAERIAEHVNRFIPSYADEHRLGVNQLV